MCCAVLIRRRTSHSLSTGSGERGSAEKICSHFRNLNFLTLMHTRPIATAKEQPYADPSRTNIFVLALSSSPIAKVLGQGPRPFSGIFASKGESGGFLYR